MAVFLAFAGVHATALAENGEFPVKPPGSYPNDPEKPNECLPEYTWPTFGGACRKVEGEDDSSGGGSTSSGASGTSTSGGNTTTSGTGAVMPSGVTTMQGMQGFVGSNMGDGTDTSTSTGGSTSGGTGTSTSGAAVECPPPDAVTGSVQRIPCDEYQDCKKDCVAGTPTCTNWTNDGSTCTCDKWETPLDCTCAPKCEIKDPEHYPYCCDVTDKGGDYPCMKVCTLPNGDKVDIVENPPSCGNFPNCCSEPEETKIGDPRDFCKMKCLDACNDKQFVDRKPPNPDFPECCTPPVPLSTACACCRESAHRPPAAYCEYFFRFFTCGEPMCQAGQTCTASGSLPPVYTLEYDKYMQFDPRYPFCSGEWNNLNCRYTCKGKGIILKQEAPKDGIWALETYENNYSLEVQRNCNIDETEKRAVPWPPPDQAQERCN